MSALELVPYRASDELETLRRENQELRAELAALKGETLYPFRPEIGKTCRMCNTGSMREIKREGAARVVELWGPTTKFEPAVSKTWWRDATPVRIRRDCIHCKAVYYEMPADTT